MATNFGSVNTGGTTDGNVAGGMGSLLGTDTRFLGRPTNAPIRRPVVGTPDRANYAPPTPPPQIQTPNRADFGPGPNRDDVNLARHDVNMFRGQYNDPTHSSAFTDLMGLSQEQTAQTAAEARRSGQDAASRAGYSGGFNAAGKQAARDRMSAVATAGFGAAKDIRDQALTGYNTAEQGLSSAISSYNGAQTAINTAFGNALSSAHEKQGDLNLGFADIVSKSNLSYADAAAQAQQLQAQLDEAFNSNLIDNAKYNQMNISLQAEWARAQAELKEKAREFNVTSAQQGHEFDVTSAQNARNATNANNTANAGINAQQLPAQLAAGRSGPSGGGMASLMNENDSTVMQRIRAGQTAPTPYGPGNPGGTDQFGRRF